MENLFKNAWAFPHRSGGVPGCSAAVREPKILIFRGPGRRGEALAAGGFQEVGRYGLMEIWRYGEVQVTK